MVIAPAAARSRPIATPSRASMDTGFLSDRRVVGRSRRPVNDRQRPVPDIDPPGQHPGHEHLGEPRAQHRRGRVRRRLGRFAVAALLGGPDRRRAAGRRGLPLHRRREETAAECPPERAVRRGSRAPTERSAARVSRGTHLPLPLRTTIFFPPVPRISRLLPGGAFRVQPDDRDHAAGGAQGHHPPGFQALHRRRPAAGRHQHGGAPRARGEGLVHDRRAGRVREGPRRGAAGARPRASTCWTRSRPRGCRARPACRSSPPAWAWASTRPSASTISAKWWPGGANWASSSTSTWRTAPTPTPRCAPTAGCETRGSPMSAS